MIPWSRTRCPQFYELHCGPWTRRLRLLLGFVGKLDHRSAVLESSFFLLFLELVFLALFFLPLFMWSSAVANVGLVAPCSSESRACQRPRLLLIIRTCILAFQAYHLGHCLGAGSPGRRWVLGESDRQEGHGPIPRRKRPKGWMFRSGGCPGVTREDSQKGDV